MMDLTQYQTNEFGVKFTLDQNGELHSYNDEPSHISAGGDMYWHKHGKRHRTSGPSMIAANGKEVYYLEGKYYSKEDWEKQLQGLKNKMTVASSMNALIKTMEENGSLDRQDISDSQHTFKELYDFRMIYNAMLFNEWAKQGLYDVHKSKCHSDGEKCFGGGWFIVVAILPDGQISNHYPESDWDQFKVPVFEKAKYNYDGHTSNDVLTRLLALNKGKPTATEKERNENDLNDEEIEFFYTLGFSPVGGNTVKKELKQEFRIVVEKTLSSDLDYSGEFRAIYEITLQRGSHRIQTGYCYLPEHSIVDALNGAFTAYQLTIERP